MDQEKSNPASFKALCAFVRRKHGEDALKRIGEILSASPQSLTNWRSRGISKNGAIAAQAAYGVDASSLFVDGVIKPISPDAAQPLHSDLPRARRVEIRGNAVMDKDGFWVRGEADSDVGYVSVTAEDDAFAIQVGSDVLDPVVKRGTILIFDSQPPRAGEYAHLVLADGREAILEFLFSTDVQQAFQSITDRRRHTFRHSEITKASGYGGQVPGHKRRHDKP